jgi:PHP family Zn ribbon phosphoesterase
MNFYRADLHIHTVLSPCGDIEMTPAFIVRQAKACGLDMIGITDHNSTLQCAEIKRIGEQEGIFVLCGAEVTTLEEVHCLVFMEDMEQLSHFQEYLSCHLPPIRNKPELFGYQLVVNEAEEVLEEAPCLLISALSQTIDQVEQEAHRLGGLFIPAHIDKQKNSLLSQLGFVPPDLRVDALELSWRSNVDAFLTQHNMLKKYSFISSSDAHYPNEFSRRHTLFRIESLTFDEVRKALLGIDGRYVESVN